MKKKGKGKFVCLFYTDVLLSLRQHTTNTCSIDARYNLSFDLNEQLKIIVQKTHEVKECLPALLQPC